MKKLAWTTIPTIITYISFIFVDAETAIQNILKPFGQYMIPLLSSAIVFSLFFVGYSIYERNRLSKMEFRAMLYLNFIRLTTKGFVPAQNELGLQYMAEHQKKEQALIRAFLLQNFPDCTAREADQISSKFYIAPTGFTAV